MATRSEPIPDLTVYSTAWCVDCKIAKAVLDRHGVRYRWIDIDREADAVEAVLRLNGGHRTVPTIVFSDGRVLVEPSRRELEQALAERARPHSLRRG
jgi:mycoredoxin